MRKFRYLVVSNYKDYTITTFCKNRKDAEKSAEKETLKGHTNVQIVRN